MTNEQDRKIDIAMQEKILVTVHHMDYIMDYIVVIVIVINLKNIPV